MKTKNSSVGWQIVKLGFWVLGRACVLAFATVVVLCAPHMGRWTDPRS